MKQPTIGGFKTTTTKAITIHLVPTAHKKEFLNKQSTQTQTMAADQNWSDTGQVLKILNARGALESLAALTPEKIGIYSLAHLPDYINNNLSSALQKNGFAFKGFKIPEAALHNAYIGWSLAAYTFDTFKKSNKTTPLLYCPATILKAIKAQIESVYWVRDLINMPPNKMGPDELAKAATTIANAHKATIKITKGKQLITQKFPLIYEVGKGSDREPCLIDFTWGNPKHKKITLVGKGVVFDTGGYDIKPSSAMLLMKKDMGGAAMTLGLAHLIMAQKLPVRLRVLIPAAENSISGNAYRPSDILTSRKGLSVEIGNTDAEGRLVMADCLTAACDDKPDLLVDFSTLTGAARSALGFDLPAMFSNDHKLAQTLQTMSMECDDPLWHMPLWAPYKKDIMSPIADINNAGSNPAGAVTAALFLEHFITPETKWIHIDHYAWELSGKAGKPRGGTDMGLRSVYRLIETLK